MFSVEFEFIDSWLPLRQALLGLGVSVVRKTQQRKVLFLRDAPQCPTDAAILASFVYGIIGKASFLGGNGRYLRRFDSLLFCSVLSDGSRNQKDVLIFSFNDLVNEVTIMRASFGDFTYKLYYIDCNELLQYSFVGNAPKSKKECFPSLETLLSLVFQEFPVTLASRPHYHSLPTPVNSRTPRIVGQQLRIVSYFVVQCRSHMSSVFF